jgi:hypothetical protein
LKALRARILESYVKRLEKLKHRLVQGFRRVRAQAGREIRIVVESEG